MRNLERNKRSISYRLYTGNTEAVDADGYFTGEKPPQYSEPVTIKASVSAARGSSDLEMFGVDVPYTNTVIVDNTSCPIDEFSVITIGSDDYAVLSVAKSLNHITYAVRKLNEAIGLSLTP